MCISHYGNAQHIINSLEVLRPVRIDILFRKGKTQHIINSLEVLRPVRIDVVFRKGKTYYRNEGSQQKISFMKITLFQV